MKIKNMTTVWLVSFILVSCMPKIMPSETAISTPSPVSHEVILTLLPTLPSLESATVSITSDWKTYTSDSFLVTLKYPAYWDVNNEGYAVYSGQDGFFQLSSSSLATPTAREWCELEIQHNPDKTGYYRYGTKPAMEVLKVDSQPACLVLPSDNQPQNQQPNFSLLVVEYPKLEEGRTRLLFFMADKNHIRYFIDTLKFVR